MLRGHLKVTGEGKGLKLLRRTREEDWKVLVNRKCNKLGATGVEEQPGATGELGGTLRATGGL